MSKIIYFLLFCYAPFGLWSEQVKPLRTDETFFSYSRGELQKISSLPLSQENLSQEKFEQWDPIIYELTKTQLSDGQAIRLMAYMYVAQRDFALLSYQMSQQWLGNPDQLIVKVIDLIYPENHLSKTVLTDPFSSKISDIVFHKIEERYKDEQTNLKEYPIKVGPTYWKEQPPYFGQRIGSCRLWLLSSLNNLHANTPPGFHSIIWAYDINQIRNDQSRLTPEQRKLIFYWAGKDGPEAGNWFAIANNALQKKNLSLPEFLFVRAIFAMSQTDSLIAAFDSKYTYWVMRPYMRNSSIDQIVPTPKHPSYPSAHSVLAANASTILSHFFPQEKEKWQKLAFESGNSRIWGGLHFMYDNEEGLIQGEKVGKAIIKRLPLLLLEKEILTDSW